MFNHSTQLTPNYQARRQALARSLPRNGVAIIPAASEIIRNGDAHYTFRQDSDFYYLTGFNEPDALLLIYAGETGESILFNRPLDPIQEQWNGARLGQERACAELLVHAAYAIDCVESKLPELLNAQSTIYYNFAKSAVWDARIMRAYQTARSKRGVIVPEVFWDLTPFLSELRLFKDHIEINYMREAARISVLAHHRAMRMCKNLHTEQELEAEILYELKRNGCKNVAYDSIVAGGKNACTLHYTANDQKLNPGELVLIDAGGEYQNYAADITRTYPINGKFSPEQALIYDLVYQAQQASIALVRPGCAWNEIQQEIIYVLTSGLVELGILHGNVNDLIEQKAYKPFYMHNSGHWLGLDVHDVGCYNLDEQSRLLQPGMVLTVEPGLYLSSKIANLDARWWDIGIRIEDDFLITADGYEQLSAGLKAKRGEIESYICN
jgi:Xaa-Pro aminopeptidase